MNKASPPAVGDATQERPEQQLFPKCIPNFVGYAFFVYFYIMEPDRIIKGSLSAVILQLLQLNGRMYGYEITKAVRDGSKGKTKITEAALYPALHKLEEAGLLETETEIVDGRSRKYYKLNRKGKKESVMQLEALQESISALQRILKYRLKNG
jgi:DNA-binding PadR family transcriptional regulator